MSTVPKCPRAETSTAPKCPHAEMSAVPKRPCAETSAVPKRPRAEMSPVPKCPCAEIALCRNVHVSKCPRCRYVHVPKRPGSRNVCAEMSIAEMLGAEMSPRRLRIRAVKCLVRDIKSPNNQQIFLSFGTMKSLFSFSTAKTQENSWKKLGETKLVVWCHKQYKRIVQYSVALLFSSMNCWS